MCEEPAMGAFQSGWRLELHAGPQGASTRVQGRESGGLSSERAPEWVGMLRKRAPGGGYELGRRIYCGWPCEWRDSISEAAQVIKLGLLIAGKYFEAITLSSNGQCRVFSGS